MIGNIYKRFVNGRQWLHEAFRLFFQFCRKQYLKHDDNYYRTIGIAKQYVNILQNVGAITNPRSLDNDFIIFQLVPIY
jgi:hypothetical protein